MVMLPERIGRLNELASNLWWSWQTQARDLFRALDYPLWRLSGHNPVKQLREIQPERLESAAADSSFLVLYDSVMSSFDQHLSGETWFDITYPNLGNKPIAYFSAEFAIHNSLPTYAGGLGVLAGDTCKEASDLGLPLVAVGFMYPEGYFHQQISADGWQQELYRMLNFDEAPVNLCPWPPGRGPIVPIQLGNRILHIRTWLVRIGRISLCLLDTNVEQNSPQDRQLSARLYTADIEQRIQQEIVLGTGGVRVLRELNIHPAVWHANEGHTAFMMLERLREEVEQGASFGEAMQRVQATTIFTTHTPVLAGHDIFPTRLLEKYFSGYLKSLGTDQETIFRLGRQDGETTQTFNMTTLALRMANQRYAVSQLHEKVARRMWHSLWPQAAEDEVPISHVTNGVHVPSWVAPELASLFEGYLGEDWIKEHDDAELWQRVVDIPDRELWAVRQLLRRKLIHIVMERAQERWARGEISAEQVLARGGLLDHDTLTIGFVRRFTEYKRATLIFQDIERLKRIINNRFHPVQIIFAGKSHPADSLSKQLLQRVYALATNREFQGRIAFVEDYDIHMAHYLVQGVDVWLNSPRRLQEACGTSGMKASLNGVLHLSVRDGWWHEGYNGGNGWAIGGDLAASGPEEEDRADAEALYRLLEEEIVPLHYARDRYGVPHDWIQRVKEAIRSVLPVYSTRRMLKEYTERFYSVAAQSTSGIEQS